MDLEGFRSLLTPAGQAVLAEIADYDEASTLVVAERLRRQHPAPLVAAALTQARLRQRAAAKFGGDAARMYFTPDGLEQSTRAAVAQHRAARFAGRALVADLCCGIGGDLLALASRAGYAVGVDRDPLTVAVAAANIEALDATATAECLDVEAYSLDEVDAVFIDPSRRSAGRRIFDPTAYSPPWPFVLQAAARAPGGAVKVAPGIDHDLVPAGAEVEWVSDGKGVKEAVLWFGDLATPGVRRRATVLPAGATLSATTATLAQDAPPPVGPPRRYLYEPDGAVVRAHLVGQVVELTGGALLDPTTAYVTSDELVRTPFARALEVLEVMPFSLKRLRSALRARDIGAVTVMKRGSALDVDALRKDLRLSGSGQAVVVLALVGGRHHALIARELPPGSGDHEDSHGS